jgi:hypothetical protein
MFITPKSGPNTHDPKMISATKIPHKSTDTLTATIRNRRMENFT